MSDDEGDWKPIKVIDGSKDEAFQTLTEDVRRDMRQIFDDQNWFLRHGFDDLYVLVPRRDGKLNGALLCGMPVREADVPRCTVLRADTP